MDPPCQRAGLFFGRRADDQVAPAASDVVALALELVGQLIGFAVRVELDSHLPRRVAVLELLFFPGLGGRLAGPALPSGSQRSLTSSVGVIPSSVSSASTICRARSASAGEST